MVKDRREFIEKCVRFFFIDCHSFFYRTHFHHQTYPAYGHHYTSRSRWFMMKAPEFLENKFVVYILTLIRLVIILPYKCVVSSV
jgi:hypothetical protein